MAAATVSTNLGTISNCGHNDDLKAFKQHIDDYLKKNTDSTDMRQHIERVKDDEDLLICYLRGRKNKPEAAWNTLLRYAQCRFKFYPNVFHDTIPARLRPLVESHIMGTLKSRDKFGRRIAFYDMSKWDPAVFSMDDLATAAVYGVETFWRLPEVMENGVIMLQNTEGFGFAHAREHSLSAIIRWRDIFLLSFPVAIKGYYNVNIPYLFGLIARISRTILPKKLKSRMYFSSDDETRKQLYEIASVDILPTWAGGKLPIEEAAEDMSFYEQYVRIN